MDPKQKWLMLAVSYFMNFSYLFAMQSYPPVISDIMKTFGISYGQAGLLMSIMGLSGIFLALPCWGLIAKWGLKRVGGLGLFICTLGALVTLMSNSFILFGIGRFMLGVGGVLTTVSSFSIVPLWFAEKDMGKAMGIKALDMSTATVITFNLYPIIASYYGWRFSFMSSTVVLLASMVSFLLVFEETPQEQGVSTFEGIANPQVWILGAIWAFFNMSIISFTTWAGTFFIESKGVPINLAFFMASLSMLISVLLAPFVGALSDKVRKRKVFIVTSSVGMAVSLLFIARLSLPFLFLPVLSFAVATPFLPVNVFSLSSQILSSERAGLSFGVLFTGNYIGALLGPLLTGYTRDVFPEFSSFFVIAIFSFLTFLSASLLRTR